MLRPDLALIHDWVAPGSRVLDLGCGDGELLEVLARDKQVTGYGLEIDPVRINACLERGVDVIEQDINEGLHNIRDDAFDLVIMTQALQALKRPDKALDEMLRIARECIITFPNFAYWRHRLHLGMKGRMPVSKALPHAWYDTPNIHLSTFKDFEQLCRMRGYTIVDRAVGKDGGIGHWTSRTWPSMLSRMAVFRIRR